MPEPPDLDKYVRDREKLVVLGKALFWDMQLGSDGRTACASCHFHAGADHRSRHQLTNPAAPFPVNHVQAMADFPFRAFSDPTDNRSAIVRDSGLRAGSAGVVRRLFTGLAEGDGAEQGSDGDSAPAFRMGELNVRQVTPRNTPSVIDAVFNVRNLWDGRASDVFTGPTPFGDSDLRANVIRVSNGQLVPSRVRILNSSLASQAVGPPLNAVEMSYEGRTWPMLGRKMLALRPLAVQKVALDDGVLGAFADAEGRGLRSPSTYLALIQAVFQPEYWDSAQRGDPEGRPAAAGDASAFTIAEFNFPLFFGLAVQAYEATLVSGESRFDRFAEGDASALTAEEQAGMRLFQSRGECTDCHLGPELTSASITNLARLGAVQRVRTGFFTDTGYIHTGVRPSEEDSGLDGKDDFGIPFSLAARQNPGPLGIAGAFKTPGLRNIEFTGPYFHNGGQASLEQVVEFYNRGGDFPDAAHLSPDVRRLNLSAAERASLVAFLKALSDDRVRFERSPFDHPELCVPAGYAGSEATEARFPRSAMDHWVSIPAVGRRGNEVPLQTFVELLQGVGADGTRAHTLTEACSIP
jgi:cytochrome c peroxidase